MGDRRAARNLAAELDDGLLLVVTGEDPVEQTTADASSTNAKNLGLCLPMSMDARTSARWPAVGGDRGAAAPR
jgi:hypothetical protein